MANNNVLNVANVCMKYIILVFVLIFIGTILFYASTDPNSLTSKTYIYILTIILPLILVFVFIQALTPVSSTSFSVYTFVGMIFAMIFISFAIYFYQYFSSTNFYIVSYVINIIVFLIVIVGLAIIFKIFENALLKMEGISGFIAQFIFYIPCLLSEFMIYLKEQAKITPNIVFILFIFEIILLLLYLYLPNLVNKIVNSNGKVLQKEPVFLDMQPIQIAFSDTLLLPNNDIPVSTDLLDRTQKSDPYLKNYSISMWIYVNNQSPSSSASYTKEISLFKYGYTDASTGISYPKPQITYDQTQNSYYIYFTTYTNNKKDDSRYKLTNFPTQRWNNFVFNYNKNNTDLFINGKLERTFSIANNLPVYNSNDIVTVGDTNGIQGAICNVVYFNKILTTSQIANSYNLNRLSKTPIK